MISAIAMYVKNGCSTVKFSLCDDDVGLFDVTRKWGMQFSDINGQGINNSAKGSWIISVRKPWGVRQK